MFDATNITATTSNVIAASVSPVAPVAPVAVQVQNDAGHKSAVVAKRSAPSSKSLSQVNRDKAKADQVSGSIGDAMQQIGETIGYYTVEKELLQSDTLAAVQSYLKQAMKHGLTVAMLKAPTKLNPSECYTCLVDALQSVRKASGLKPLADATRDNYLSRIRSYIRDCGANPLDLFGNIAMKAKKEADQKTVAQAKAITATLALATPEPEEVEEPEVIEATDKEFIGVPALHTLLNKWHKQNDVGMVAEKYRVMVADFLKMMENELPTLKGNVK